MLRAEPCEFLELVLVCVCSASCKALKPVHGYSSFNCRIKLSSMSSSMNCLLCAHALRLARCILPGLCKSKCERRLWQDCSSHMILCLLQVWWDSSIREAKSSTASTSVSPRAKIACSKHQGRLSTSGIAAVLAQ